MRHTKIVATLGPVSNNPGILTGMIDAGLDVVRLNTSHGLIDEHRRSVALVRECADARGKSVAVLMDLGGPKLRTGPTDGGRPLNLRTGAPISLTNIPVNGHESLVTVDYPYLLEDVRPGGIVLLDDGRIELRVLNVSATALECMVVVGGLLAPNKGVAFPASTLTLPALTDRDREAIVAGVDCGVDLFALSFVNSPADIELTRRAIHDAGNDTPIIAKIERRQAVEQLDAIIAEADGVMVARGDMAVDLSPEEVPIQQRRIIESAARNKVPVITATQMLESMVDNPRPTRAEASDVANAVWDLSDAVMLSAETAVGRFPVETVAMMDRIIRRAEAEMPRGETPLPHYGPADHSFVISVAARRIVDTDPHLKAIVCFTNSGYSALLMSKAYPGVPIVALSPNSAVVRRLSVARSVLPVVAPAVKTVEEMFASVDEILVQQGFVEAGDEVLVTGSLPVAVAGTTNFLKLHTVGEGPIT